MLGSGSGACAEDDAVHRSPLVSKAKLKKPIWMKGGILGECETQCRIFLKSLLWKHITSLSEAGPIARSLARFLSTDRITARASTLVNQRISSIERIERRLSSSVTNRGLLTSPSAEEEDFAYVRRLERNLLDHLPHVERQLSEEVERVQLSDEGLHAGELW
ncbi:hypothetical protein Trihar35433_8901 [Trichoderma harzianum]|nr:hypothetical protein Trihar35433_8901 [Trichoderma harzianum]